ncbi:unnamed protein product [Calypogeia fissa]
MSAVTVNGEQGRPSRPETGGGRGWFRLPVPTVGVLDCGRTRLTFSHFCSVESAVRWGSNGGCFGPKKVNGTPLRPRCRPVVGSGEYRNTVKYTRTRRAGEEDPFRVGSERACALLLGWVLGSVCLFGYGGRSLLLLQQPPSFRSSLACAFATSLS